MFERLGSQRRSPRVGSVMVGLWLALSAVTGLGVGLLTGSALAGLIAVGLTPMALMVLLFPFVLRRALRQANQHS